MHLKSCCVMLIWLFLGTGYLMQPSQPVAKSDHERNFPLFDSIEDFLPRYFYHVPTKTKYSFVMARLCSPGPLAPHISSVSNVSTNHLSGSCHLDWISPIIHGSSIPPPCASQEYRWLGHDFQRR
jgi:hypothetical protein